MARRPYCRDVTVGVSPSGLAPLLRSRTPARDASFFGVNSTASLRNLRLMVATDLPIFRREYRRPEIGNRHRAIFSKHRRVYARNPSE